MSRHGIMRRVITALLLVVVACVGIAGCTTTQIKVTRDDRESAEQAADRVNRGKFVADDNVAARHVPSCTTAPVDVDTCARDIAEARAEGNLGLGPREKVFSLPKTAGLIGGLLVAVVVIGGGALMLRGKRPTLAEAVDKLPRGRRPGSSPSPTQPPAPTPTQPPRPPVHRPSPPSPAAPPQASSGGGYLPPRRTSAPPPATPMRSTDQRPNMLVSGAAQAVPSAPAQPRPRRQVPPVNLPSVPKPTVPRFTLPILGVSVVVIGVWMVAWRFVAEGRDDNTQPIYGDDGSRHSITPYGDSFGDITPTLLLVIAVTLAVLVAVLALASKPARRWISLRHIEGDIPAQRKKLIVLIAAGVLVAVGFTVAGLITSALLDSAATKESGVCLVRGDAHDSSCR